MHRTARALYAEVGRAAARVRDRGPCSKGGQKVLTPAPGRAPEPRLDARASFRALASGRVGGGRGVDGQAGASRASRGHQIAIRGQLLWLRSSSGVAKMAAFSYSLERSRTPQFRGTPAVPQPLASRPTSRSSCAVRVHEARHPGATHGAPHTLPQLACVAVRAARSLPAAGSNLPMIASGAFSQPHRARCGSAIILALSRTAPPLVHHHGKHVQVPSGVSTAAAAVEPTTSGATRCGRRPQRAGGRQVGGGGRARAAP